MWTARRIMECKSERLISRGRPKLRWEDGVDEKLNKLGIKGWWKVTIHGGRSLGKSWLEHGNSPQDDNGGGGDNSGDNWLIFVLKEEL